MGKDSSAGVERRVILSGALAGIAVGVVGCSSSGEDAEAAGPETRTTSAPTLEPVVDEPVVTGEFGGLIDAEASVEDLLVEIEESNGFAYRPRARAWVVAYPIEHVEKAKSIYPEAIHESLDNGFLVLFQKCPHLGCRVPECPPSQQFECPCHGSQYSPTGEHLAGPAPRGMDLMAASVIDGSVVIDTGTIHEGLPIGTNITEWELAETAVSCLGDLAN